MTTPEQSTPVGTVLTELLPRKARLALYLFAALGSSILALWTAADGSWLVFVLGLFTMFQALLAASNVNPPVTEAEPLP